MAMALFQDNALTMAVIIMVIEEQAAINMP